MNRRSVCEWPVKTERTAQARKLQMGENMDRKRFSGQKDKDEEESMGLVR